jgi:hypothetical protein
MCCTEPRQRQALYILNVYALTGSLRHRQSQKSFNTLTPFNFFLITTCFAPTGHPQVRYTISQLKDYFNTTDPLHV